jgi:hypothetical protein
VKNVIEAVKKGVESAGPPEGVSAEFWHSFQDVKEAQAVSKALLECELIVEEGIFGPKYQLEYKGQQFLKIERIVPVCSGEMGRVA